MSSGSISSTNAVSVLLPSHASLFQSLPDSVDIPLREAGNECLEDVLKKTPPLQLSEHNPAWKDLPRFRTRAQAYAEFDELHRAGKPYPFYLTQIETNDFNVLLAGCTPNGTTTAFTVRGFHPFVFGRLRDFKTNEKLEKNWLGDVKTQNDFFQQISQIPVNRRFQKTFTRPKRNGPEDTNMEDDFETCTTELKEEDRRSCIGFQYGRREKTYEIYFTDYEAFRYFTTDIFTRTHEFLVNGKSVYFQTFHKNWTMERQFLLFSGLRLFEWMEIDSTQIQTRQQEVSLTSGGSIPLWHRLTTDFRGSVDVEYVRKSPQQLELSKKPPPIRIAVYDIETVSQRQIDVDQHPDKKGKKTYLPPKLNRAKDYVIAIHTQFYFFGKEKVFWKVTHCLHSASVQRKDKTVYSFDRESDLLEHWAGLVTRIMDVDGWMGYNNFQYDTEYMFHRGVCVHKIPIYSELGRIQGQPNGRWGSHRRAIHSTSNQFGDQYFNFITKPLRWEADTLIGVAKNERLRSNKLKDAAKDLLKSDVLKDDLDYEQITKMFVKGPAERGIIVDYNEQDVNVTFALDQKCKYLEMYMKIGQITNTGMNDIMIHGETRRSWHIIQERIYNYGWFIDEDERLHIQDTYGIPRPSSSFNMAKTETIPDIEDDEEDRALEPKIQQIGWKNEENLLKNKKKRKKSSKVRQEKKARLDADNDTVTQEKQRKLSDWFGVQKPKVHRCGCNLKKKGADPYKGGYVKDPERGLYKRPTVTLDFASLYPSIIRAKKICPTTFIPCKPDTTEPDIPEEFKSRTDPLSRMIGTRMTHFVDAFDKKRVPDEDNIIPAIEEQLVQERKIVKRRMEEPDVQTNKSLYDALDVMQKAIKVVANGMYGALGSTFMAIALRPVAIMITQFGRENTQMGERIISNVGDKDFIRGGQVNGHTYNTLDYMKQHLPELCTATAVFLQKNEASLTHLLSACSGWSNDELFEYWITWQWNVLSTNAILGKKLKLEPSEKKQLEHLVEASRDMETWVKRIIFLRDLAHLSGIRYAVQKAPFLPITVHASNSLASLSSSSSSSNSLASFNSLLSPHLQYNLSYPSDSATKSNTKAPPYEPISSLLKEVPLPKSSSSSSSSSSSAAAASASASSWSPANGQKIWSQDLIALEKHYLQLIQCSTKVNEVEKRIQTEYKDLPALDARSIASTLQDAQQFVKFFTQQTAGWMDLKFLDKQLMWKRTLLHARLSIYAGRQVRPWRVLYGDTDSLFPQVPTCFFHPTLSSSLLLLRSSYYHSVWLMGIGLQDLVNPLYPPPMTMELEKFFSPFLLYCAKMYRYCERSIFGALLKIKDKGLPMARRDVAVFSKNIMLQAMDLITAFKPKEAMETLAREIKKMETPEKLDYLDFVRTVTRKKEYANRNCFQVHLWNMLKRKYDMVYPIGTRVKFVILRPPTCKPDQDWKERLLDLDHFERENEEYAKTPAGKRSGKPLHQIDYLHYFRLLETAMVKLLSVYFTEKEVLDAMAPTRRALKKTQMGNTSIEDFLVHVPPSARSYSAVPQQAAPKKGSTPPLLSKLPPPNSSNPKPLFIRRAQNPFAKKH